MRRQHCSGWLFSKFKFKFIQALRATLAHKPLQKPYFYSILLLKRIETFISLHKNFDKAHKRLLDIFTLSGVFLWQSNIKENIDLYSITVWRIVTVKIGMTRKLEVDNLKATNTCINRHYNCHRLNE